MFQIECTTHVCLELHSIYHRSWYFAPVTTLQVLDFSACIVNISADKTALILSVHLYDQILRFILSAMLLILAVAQSSRQLLLMYKATKQWHLNRYMQRLTADGILYFVVYAFSFPSHSFPFIQSRSPRNVYFSIGDILQYQPALNIYVTTFLQLTSFTTITPLIPRFIISVREIYDRDTNGCLQVDTGFGALGRFVDDKNGLVSTIVFADRNPGQGQSQAAEDDADDSERIRLEVRAGGVH